MKRCNDNLESIQNHDQPVGHLLITSRLPVFEKNTFFIFHFLPTTVQIHVNITTPSPTVAIIYLIKKNVQKYICRRSMPTTPPLRHNFNLTNAAIYDLCDQVHGTSRSRHPNPVEKNAHINICYIIRTIIMILYNILHIFELETQKGKYDYNYY